MKNNISKIVAAPLYTVIGNINSKSVLNFRVISLTKAKEKDSIWSYPSTGGTKYVPASKLNQIVSDEHCKYRGFCTTKKLVGEFIEMVKSIHAGAEIPVKPVAEIIPTAIPEPKVTKLASKVTSAVKIQEDKTITGRTFSKIEQQDVDAVNAVLAGHKEKFSVIYKRYYPIILQSYSSKLKFNRELAEDVAADLFMKIYQSLDKYQVKYTFNSWITRVAKNFLIDYIRKQKLETVSIDAGVSSDKMKNEDSDSITLDICDERETPEQAITNIEKNNVILNLINSMEPNSREAVKKYYFDDKSYEEIAEEMNIPLGTLKSIIFRAKKTMKTALEKNISSLAVVLD